MTKGWGYIYRLLYVGMGIYREYNEHQGITTGLPTVMSQAGRPGIVQSLSGELNSHMYPTIQRSGGGKVLEIGARRWQGF